MAQNLKDKAELILKKEKPDLRLVWILSAFMMANNEELYAYRVERIFNRPFSLVFNVETESTAKKKNRIFVKIYKGKNTPNLLVQLQREYEITKYWHQKFRSHPYFHTVEPLWVDLKHFILITRESPGKNFLSFLGQNIRFFPKHHLLEQAEHNATLVGQWLSYFQNFPLEDDIPFLDASVRIEYDHFIKYINTRMERMVMNPRILFNKELQTDVNKVIAKLFQKIDQKTIQTCISHSDLSLSNILIHQNHVTVLDFSKSEINSPFKDLARLYHQLHLLSYKPVYSNAVISRLQHALLRGWGNAQADREPLFKIYYLIHLITHLGKSARYWEHNFIENMYNRWVVRKTMRELKDFLAHELQTKN